MEATKRTAEEERQSYLDGYEKDAAAWRARLSDLEALGKEGEQVYEQAKEGLENALRHLSNLGGESQEKAQKRPAARAKETR